MITVMPVTGALGGGRRYFFSDDPDDDLSWCGLWRNMWKQVASFWITDLMVLAATGFGDPFVDDPDRVEVRRIVPELAWNGGETIARNLVHAYKPRGVP